MPYKATDPMIRIEKYISRSESCWAWTGTKDSSGYGRFKLSKYKTVSAHRFYYERTRGPIGQGLQIDHLCRNRACVNPDHLEPVTQRENCIRGISPIAQNANRTHCIRGHEFPPSRKCVICTRARARLWAQKDRAKRREASETDQSRAPRRQAKRRAGKVGA